MALPHEPLKGYLANVEAELSEAVRECESLRTQVERLRAALVTIETWAMDRKSGHSEIVDVLDAIADRAKRASNQ